MSPWAFWIAAAAAHALAPAGLDLTLIDATHADVVWRTPVREPTGESLDPVWPPGCTLAAGDPFPDEAGALVVRGRLTCAGPIVGQELAIAGLSGASVDVVVTVRGDEGRVRRVLLHDPVDRWTIAAPEDASPSAPDWGRAARVTLAAAIAAACVEALHRRPSAPVAARLLAYGVGALALAWGWRG